MKCQGVASLEQVVEFVSSMVAKDAFSSFRHWKRQEKIESIGVNTVIRNNNQSNVLPSLSNTKPVELFIKEIDFGKANSVIEEFRLSI